MKIITVKSIEPAIGDQPNQAVIDRMDTIHQDIATWKKLIRATVIAKADKLITIVTIKTLARPDPHQSLLVLGHRGNTPESQAIFDREGLTGQRSLCKQRRRMAT